MAGFIGILTDPDLMIIISLFCIFSYLIVSAFFFGTKEGDWKDGKFDHNGLFDIVTSVLWSSSALLMLASLILLSDSNTLSIRYLIVYYVLLVFLFSICYSLLEWHFNGHFAEKDENPWKGEVQFLVMSIQMQTTLGSTRLKPVKLLSELLTAIQALMGLFFVVIFIARAVNQTISQ